MDYETLEMTLSDYNFMMALSGTLFGYAVLFLMAWLFTYMGRK